MLTALFDKFQGKTGQGGSAANFLLAQERQYKKRLLVTMASGGRATNFGTQTRTPREVQLPSQGATTLRAPRTLR